MNQGQLHLIKLLKPLKMTGLFVEVGTWQGDFASTILGFLDCRMLYCIDPYTHFADDIYKDSMNLQLKGAHGTNLYESTKQRLEKKAPGRIEMIRKTSLEAVNNFEDETLDFVYIDANHAYEYVLKDILAWYPKVKQGGILAGDNIWSTDMNQYNKEKNMIIQFKNAQRSTAYFGVYPAVKAAEEQLGIEFHIIKTQFYCLKS
jgi:hypothetical protein